MHSARDWNPSITNRKVWCCPRESDVRSECDNDYVHRRFLWLCSRWQLSLSGEINISARQEVCRVLWDQKLHHRVHKSLPLDHYLNQINRPCNFFKAHINIVLLSTPWSYQQPLSSVLVNENPPCSSVHFHACQMSHFIPSMPSSYFMYHFSNAQQLYFLPTQCIYVFVWIWEQTAIISLYSFNWLVFKPRFNSL